MVAGLEPATCVFYQLNYTITRTPPTYVPLQHQLPLLRGCSGDGPDFHRGQAVRCKLFHHRKCGDRSCSPENVVRPEGVEPPTRDVEDRCSIQLSYGRKLKMVAGSTPTGLTHQLHPFLWDAIPATVPTLMRAFDVLCRHQSTSLDPNFIHPAQRWRIAAGSLVGSF